MFDLDSRYFVVTKLDGSYIADTFWGQQLNSMIEFAKGTMTAHRVLLWKGGHIDPERHATLEMALARRDQKVEKASKYVAHDFESVTIYIDADDLNADGHYKAWRIDDGKHVPIQ